MIVLPTMYTVRTVERCLLRPVELALALVDVGSGTMRSNTPISSSI